MLQRKFASVLLAALVFSLSANDAVACNDTKGRIQVRLFKYSGVVSGGAQDAFSNFHDYLDERVRHLQSKVAGHPHGKHLAGIHIYPESTEHGMVQKAPSEAHFKVVWEFYDYTLVLLTGAMYGNSVGSRVFWGDLHPPGLSPAIRTTWQFSGNDFISAYDVHSMIMLVALGQDAKRRNCSVSLVVHIFSEADKIAMDLERRCLEAKVNQATFEQRCPLVSDVAKLREFIAEELKRVMGS